MIYNRQQTIDDKPKSFQLGFTLVELLVAMSIFAMTMLLITSSLLAMVDANRRGQALSSVMNNLNFALESITRNIRTGTNYSCGSSYPPSGDCSNGTNFRFTAQNGLTVGYRLNGTTLQRTLNDGTSWQNMTAPEVVITSARFYLTGTASWTSSGADTEVQPRAVMIIQGTATIAGEQTAFNIQTSVVQRTPDH